MTGDRRVTARILVAIVVASALARPVLAQSTPSPADAMRPVAVWPSGPLEIIAAFDKALEPAAAAAFVGKSIAYSEPAEPPGGRNPSPRPLGALRIVGARLTDAGRTLTLATDPHPRLASYVLPVPKGPPETSIAGEGRYDLSGAEVTWTPAASADDRPVWTGWWPRIDLAATQRLTEGSKHHEEGLALSAKPGRLTLGTLVRLPAGAVTVRIESSQPIDEATLGEAQAELTGPEPPAQRRRALLRIQSLGDPLFLSIACRTGSNCPPYLLTASYRSGDSTKDHELERGQTILPWAPVPAPAAMAPVLVPDLSGGDSARGKAIFSGEKARCSQCHAFRGQGGKVGPDLGEIGKKGSAEIYRAIAAPSAAIDPEFMSYTVATKSGQVVLGVVRAEGPDTIRVTDTNAHTVVINRLEIDQIRPSANSVMPVGLTGALGDTAVRDLIAFLTDRSGNTH
jgi:putative heme-binding domain-containing protein